MTSARPPQVNASVTGHPSPNVPEKCQETHFTAVLRFFTMFAECPDTFFNIFPKKIYPIVFLYDFGPTNNQIPSPLLASLLVVGGSFLAAPVSALCVPRNKRIWGGTQIREVSVEFYIVSILVYTNLKMHHPGRNNPPPSGRNNPPFGTK